MLSDSRVTDALFEESPPAAPQPETKVGRAPLPVGPPRQARLLHLTLCRAISPDAQNVEQETAAARARADFLQLLALLDRGEAF